MPYLILFFGLLVGVYAFMRFFTKADVNDVRTIFAWMGFALLTLILLFLAVTGRIIPAIVILVLLLPFVLAHVKAQVIRPKGKNLGRRASDQDDVIDVDVSEFKDESSGLNGHKVKVLSDKRKGKSDDRRS